MPHSISVDHYSSLVLVLENGKPRLTWSSPVLDDGNGAPKRRPMGSDEPFVKNGATTGMTFVDAAAGTGLWEYVLTAIIPKARP